MKPLSTFLLSLLIVATAIGNTINPYVYRRYVGSGTAMYPELAHGQIIYVEPIDYPKLKVGMIVARQMLDRHEDVATRLIAYKEVTQEWITKADHNDVPDAGAMSDKHFIGRVVNPTADSSHGSVRVLDNKQKDLYALTPEYDMGYPQGVIAQQSIGNPGVPPITGNPVVTDPVDPKDPVVPPIVIDPVVPKTPTTPTDPVDPNPPVNPPPTYNPPVEPPVHVPESLGLFWMIASISSVLFLKKRQN